MRANLFKPEIPKDMINTLRIIFGLYFIFLSANCFGQDTTPPTLLSAARDTSFECGQTSGLIEKLTLWFNNAGGASFEDNSGSYTIQSNITLAQAITIFNNSLDILCGNKQKVEVIFTAVDPSGNVSLPTTASFFTTDVTPPTINNVPKVQYNCVQGIRDTLIAWIKNKGGYIAFDLCSNSVQWTTYTYAIASNGIDLITGGGNISSGPYPMIPDGVCNWVLRINFFVQDECGNLTITPATTTFTVTDNVPPVFVQRPADITVSCDNIPIASFPSVIDYCDRSVIPTLNTINSQSVDSASCGFYNYTITRIWTATDECGNSSSHTQVITVRDDKKPEVLPNPSITLSCKIFNEHRDSIYLKFSDNCSPVQVSFEDETKTSACTSVIERTYTLSDVCTNTTEYKQLINVTQDVQPKITKNARNKTFKCTDQEDFDAQLFLWTQNMGESEALATCGQLLSFAALKNSYNKDDPGTFPGIAPTTLPAQICPSPLEGFLRYLEVDFVYYDTCGNVAISSAVFGIADTLAPITTHCPDDIIVSVDAIGCIASVKLKVPEANDDCVESSSFIIKQATVAITSADPPGPTSIIDPVTLKIGPFNPFTSLPLADGILTIRLTNLDIDDATEFFNIYDEDNTFIGITKIGSDQCATIEMTLNLPKDKLNRWVQDGFIDLRFEPFVAPGNPVLSINNICGGSKIEASVGYQIDIVNAIRKSYSIDGEEEIMLSTQDSIIVFLNAGEHHITFTMEDCSKNKSQCIVKVQVKDESKPIITCPNNFSTALTRDLCQAQVSVPINFIVEENCSGNRGYDQTSPSSNEAASILFALNSSTGQYEAINKQIIFTNVFPIRFLNKNVVLDIDFFGDNNEVGEYFEIFGPDGFKIGNTKIVNDGGCNTLSLSSFEIPYNIFNTWINNKNITILAVPFNGNDGINPCMELPNGQSTDNKSYIRGRLRYSDMSFTLSSTGATTINNINIPVDSFSYMIGLNGGKNNITIKTADQAGNEGICTFEVNVRDTQQPLAKCKNAVITLDPSGLTSIIINPDLINDGSIDNCKIAEYITVPSEVNCTQANQDISVSLIVIDEQGNSDTCTSLVRVKPFELKPTFTSGLCSNDTLKLFANVPPSSVPGTYTFRWNGPGNIEFFTENPTIPNADESYNGVYVLTVTGFNGCISMGSVTVNIKPLTNPVLLSNEKEICHGSEVIFTTSNYSGNIFYDWYEGIFPTGILIRTTQNPELIIQPSTLDAHFYYVIARGPDCSSNPSPLLKITVLEVPEAKVKDLFLSPCEGDDITLGSLTNNPKFTYRWSGPNGYTSQGANPLIINNVSNNNAGNYLLVVNNGKCVSDTAITRVEIFERPSKPKIAGADIFCEGVIFNLVATGSANVDKYEWFLNGILFTTTLDNSLTISNAQSALQGTWTVITTKGNCTSLSSDPKDIGIDVSLQIGAINSGPVCMGDSVLLEATFVPNATYKWEGPVSNIPSVYNPTILGVPGDYSVTITTITGCKNNANTNVSVIAVPQITALSNSATTCMSATDTIRFLPSIFPDTNIYTYKWTGPDNFTSNNKNPFITNLSEKNIGIYSLVIFNGNCPSNELSTSVQFSILPNQPNLTAAPYYCVGDSILILSSESLDNADYIWNTPLGIMITKTPFLLLNNAGLNNGGSYSLIIAASDCGSKTSESIEIIIRDKPSKAVITTNSPICHGDTIILQASGMAGLQFKWSGPNVANASTSKILIPNASKANAGSFQVQITKDGCISDISDAVSIIVKDSITIPIFATSLIALCHTNSSGAEICFQTNSLQPGAVYSILHTATQQIIAQGNNVCQYFTDMNMLNEGANFLTAFASFEGCHSNLSLPLVINLNVPPNIKAEAIEDNIIACPDEIVQLISKDGPPLVNVKWTAINPSIKVSDNDSVAPSVSELQSGNNLIYLDYSVVGCPDYSRDTINIYVEFKPSTANDEYLLTYNEKGIFDILSNDIIPNESNITLLTQPKNGVATLVENRIEYSPDPRFLETQTFIYQVCADLCENLCHEAQVTVRFDDNVVCKAPSIFTPNGDGINDLFVIPCLQTDRFPDNKVMIFNEWGSEVFYGAPYSNDWNGTYGSNELPAGTYFYIIDTGDGRQPINGFLILQR
jgi:gliding motility-associated-like protein